MNEKLTVWVSERTGLAFTRVPGHSMWELVEYLAAQRVNVSYGYSTEGFTVTFQRMSMLSAQRLLDAWAESRIPDPCLEAEANQADDFCYIPG
jgi:hypothetical protein